jgi:hypothetical protein
VRQLDEISRIIGSIESELKSLGRSMDRDRELADDRHQENLGNFQQIEGRVENLERSVTPVADTVASWKPIIDGLLISRWKRAGALSLASAIVSLLAWLIIEFFGKAGGWILSLLHLKG